MVVIALSSRKVSLKKLVPADVGRIVRVHGPDEEELSSYGIYPGARIQVCQTFPSFVIRTDETELALEDDVVGSIEVMRGV